MTDVVVVGGGISGLSAAVLLSEQGLNVLVLEARDRVGGRTYTVCGPEYGGYTDLGGAYFGPTQRRVVRLAKRFGLEFYKVSAELKSVWSLAGKWGTYRGTVPPIYNPIAVMDVNNLQLTLDAMAKHVPPEAPWRAAKAREWDSITVKEFAAKTCWTDSGRSVAGVFCRAIMCAEPHEVSLLAFLTIIALGQGLQRVVNVTDGAQERKIVGGSQQLSEKMAATLGDRVRLSSPVARVEQSGKAVKVYTANGEKFDCQYVISSVPQAILNRITFVPPLPVKKLQLIQRIPMGSVIKTMTFYDKAYWREKGLSGHMTSDVGPVIFCLDDTKPDGSAPCIMGFIFAGKAREMTGVNAEDRKKAVAAHYAEKFRCRELLHPVNYVEMNWAEEEFSGGCYVCSLPPGVLTEFGEEIRRPFNQVYFAGTESATYWMGHMEGAIQAGERAAREILHAMGRIAKSEIWQDEPPVPDVPEKPLEPKFMQKILPSVPKFLAGTTVVLAAAAAAAVAYLSERQ